MKVLKLGQGMVDNNYNLGMIQITEKLMTGKIWPLIPVLAYSERIRLGKEGEKQSY